MKIITNEGEFELVELNEEMPISTQAGSPTELRPSGKYALEPVKKTEKNFEVEIRYWSYERKTVSSIRVEFKEPVLTEPAHKLSEAISAVVEYVTTGKGSVEELTVPATEAMQEYWESQ